MMFMLRINPATLWIKWLWTTWRMQHKHRRQSLEIRYMAVARDCAFGRFNTLYERAVLLNSSLGDYSYVAAGSRLSRVKIGKFCSIGPEVLAGLGRHPTHSFVSTHPAFYSTLRQAQATFAETDHFEEFSKIEIGHDVWIGARAIVLDGVRIGNGAIVGAGAVVTKDVPPYAVVAGIPARVMKYRFLPDQITFLEAFCWWDRSDSWLYEHRHIFRNINEFILAMHVS